MAKNGDSPKPTRSPERDRLSLAILERNRHAQSAAKAREAVTRARTLVDDAEIEFEQARQTIDAVREADALELAEAVRGGGALPASGLARARAEHAASGDKLEAVRTALSHVQDALEASEDALRKAQAAVRRAACAVMSAETTGYLSEVQRLRDELVAKASSLAWLIRIGAIDDSPIEPGKPRHADPFMRHSSPSVNTLRGMGWAGWAPDWLHGSEENAAAEAWRAALARLERDPDATLPTGSG
jgi:hypothetical protein